jgi:predicted dithiol-disulfide oxidoreductase (DUF899 family)
MPTATEEIQALEKQINELKEQLAKLRQTQPRTPVGEYTFKTHDGGEVKLSELFGDKDDLILIHNMGSGCVYCTLWADGFNSSVDHLSNRAAFVVVSPNTVEQQIQFAKSRGWNFRMVSAQESPFNKDMGFEESPGDVWPGVTTFHREKDGSITKVSSAFFGPGDEYCITWSFLDLLAEGANGWEPQYKY